MNTPRTPKQSRPVPQRIICLTEETTETLYLLGEEDRIIGISGYTVRPPEARRQKPKVSAFTSAKIDKIIDLKPDLVLGFSDLQADIAAELIRAGIAVHIFNQRSVLEILDMIACLSGIIGEQQKGDELILELQNGLTQIQKTSALLSHRPKVYFEEWHDPLISGIRWVSELIEMAGGQDCFAELAQHQGAKQRIIADPMEVVSRAPDIIIGSWCGKRFRPDSLLQRPGWANIPAIQNKQIFEIKSCDILQPGPAALTDGVNQIHKLIKQWNQSHGQAQTMDKQS